MEWVTPYLPHRLFTALESYHGSLIYYDLYHVHVHVHVHVPVHVHARSYVGIIVQKKGGKIVGTRLSLTGLVTAYEPVDMSTHPHVTLM